MDVTENNDYKLLLSMNFEQGIMYIQSIRPLCLNRMTFMVQCVQYYGHLLSYWRNKSSDKFKIVEEIEPYIIVLVYDQDWDEKELEQELE